LIFVCTLHGQETGNAKSNHVQPAKRQILPTARLVFADGGSISGLPGSIIATYPFQYSPDGLTFMQVSRVPDLMKAELYGISTNGVVEFPKGKVPDLHNVIVQRYYASASRIFLLILASREQHEAQTRTSDRELANVVPAGKLWHYLVEFDRDGSYKRTVELDDTLAPVEFGAFESGSFLVLGLVRSTGVPKLEIIGSDGTVLSILDVPKETEDWSKKSRGEQELSRANLMDVPRAQIVPFNDKIVVVTTGSGPVLEVRDGGAIREVQIHVQPDQTIDSIMTTKDRWYVRINGPSVDTEETSGADTADPESLLYEINPNDGKVLRRIDTGKVPPTSIACVIDQQFIAIRYDKDAGKFHRMIGEIKY
jgi:hypothetical protein